MFVLTMLCARFLSRCPSLLRRREREPVKNPSLFARIAELRIGPLQSSAPQRPQGHPSMVDLNRVLRSAQEGDARAAEELAVLLYDELHELARREMSAERPDHTLQPTALVNEAYLRLVADKDGSFADRDGFFAAAATAIRRVLVDHARKRAREKRGGGFVRVPLAGLDVAEPLEDEELLTLDDALARLASIDPTKARIVELRFFGGLSVEELTQAIGVSESTIRREWRVARAWLRAQMDESRGA
jgi:RNA polymerase sigma factor (TIGR02999 family)